MIHASLVSLYEARVLLNIYAFTNPVSLLIFWYSCSSSILFTRFITYRKYLMKDFGRMLLSPHQESTALTNFCNCSARPQNSKGRPQPSLILAYAISNESY